MRTTHSKYFLAVALTCALVFTTTIAHATDALPSWNDGKAKQSSIGRLDKGLDEAKQKGWTVVDITKDWKRIFPFEKD
jgi:hypothetical protein